MTPLKCSTWVLVLYELGLFTRALCEDHLYNTLHGSVGEGNYTYYKLVHMGYIRLVLDSTHGDTDLYVSTTTTAPSYDDFEICATSCGQDIVEITPSMERPVTIGVYGHPSHQKSSYDLHVMVLTNYDTGYPEEMGIDDETHSSAHSRSNSKQHKKGFSTAGKEEEESILWTILVSILKILFDVLV